MNQVEQHFDAIAGQYDFFKKKNWYYYENLKKCYREIIPAGKKILEIGCGTGDIIAALNSSEGFGIDVSSGMIDIAKKKHPEITFEAVGIEGFSCEPKFDYIILADVIEHLENISGASRKLNRLCNSSTVVVFTYANPLWEPGLLLLEKLGLKMPEGPHYRIPFRKLKKILTEHNFTVVERGWRLLVPANIPLFASWINAFFYNIPGLKRFGMLEYIILKKRCN